MVQHDVFSNPRLLNIPTKRAAWSDRTALLMAEMSKLAYYKFELDSSDEVIPQGDLDDLLARLLAPGDEAVASPSSEQGDEEQVPALPEGAVKLKKDLAKAGFELGGLFSHKATDTQAFLAISTSDPGSKERPFGKEEVAILSFRGTGTRKDWRTNVKLLQENVEGAEVHGGFQRALSHRPRF